MEAARPTCVAPERARPFVKLGRDKGPLPFYRDRFTSASFGRRTRTGAGLRFRAPYRRGPTAR